MTLFTIIENILQDIDEKDVLINVPPVKKRNDILILRALYFRKRVRTRDCC